MRVVLRLLGEELRAVGVVVLRTCLGSKWRLNSLGIGQLQRPVNLVGGDVVEALPLVAFGLAFPVFLCRLQQCQRAYHVGVGESDGVFYAPVHVAFGGKVDDAVHAVLLHQRLHRPVVADVRLYEGIVLLVLHVFQVGKITGIRQLV